MKKTYIWMLSVGPDPVHTVHSIFDIYIYIRWNFGMSELYLYIYIYIYIYIADVFKNVYIHIYAWQMSQCPSMVAETKQDFGCHVMIC